jgi:LysM repeat protein
VQPGESVYGIAKQFGISQDALMKANGIDDPRKLRAGARLSIPSN